MKNLLPKRLNYIIRLPEKIPCDKRIHALIGSVFSSVMLMITLNLYIVLPLLVTLAWGIEYFQKWTGSGTFDHWDAIAVVLGGLIPIAPVLQFIL